MRLRPARCSFADTGRPPANPFKQHSLPCRSGAPFSGHPQDRYRPYGLPTSRRAADPGGAGRPLRPDRDGPNLRPSGHTPRRGAPAAGDAAQGAPGPRMLPGAKHGPRRYCGAFGSAAWGGPPHGMARRGAADQVALPLPGRGADPPVGHGLRRRSRADDGKHRPRRSRDHERPGGPHQPDHRGLASGCHRPAGVQHPRPAGEPAAR